MVTVLERPAAHTQGPRRGGPSRESELQVFSAYLQFRARPNTVKAYLYELSRWFRWLEAGSYEPAQESAQRYLNAMVAAGSAPNSVAMTANAIRRWFKYKNTSIELDSPRVQLGEPEYLEVGKVEELIASCTNSLERVLIIMLFDTGCRISELLNIKLEDIDWDNSLIEVTRKGGRIAQVNVSDRGAAALRDWIKLRESESKSVFMNMDYHTAWRAIRDVGRRAGINVHPHMLRHSRAVHILESGEDIYVAQQVLGHTSINTTMNVYGRLKPMALKKRIPKW